MTKLRKCSLCKLELELTSVNFHKNKNEVDGFDYRCKKCKLTHYNSNKEKYKSNSISWQKNNPEKNSITQKKYKQSEKGVTTRKKYRKKEYDQKYGVDMEWTILRNLRIRLRHALKKEFKSGKTIELLGCSIKEYIVYLEKQFDENMNWGNYGTYWEVDHIQPLSKGGSFHYTNTQPMHFSENRSKGNRV
jgi:5-methylcytosine-specific restriction endonuclease McrA